MATACSVDPHNADKRSQQLRALSELAEKLSRQVKIVFGGRFLVQAVPGGGYKVTISTEE